MPTYDYCVSEEDSVRGQPRVIWQIEPGHGAKNRTIIWWKLPFQAFVKTLGGIILLPAHIPHVLMSSDSPRHVQATIIL